MPVTSKRCRVEKIQLRRFHQSDIRAPLHSLSEITGKHAIKLAFGHPDRNPGSHILQERLAFSLDSNTPPEPRYAVKSGAVQILPLPVITDSSVEERVVIHQLVLIRVFLCLA